MANWRNISISPGNVIPNSVKDLRKVALGLYLEILHYVQDDVLPKVIIDCELAIVYFTNFNDGLFLAAASESGELEGGGGTSPSSMAKAIPLPFSLA